MEGRIVYEYTSVDQFSYIEKYQYSKYYGNLFWKLYEDDREYFLSLKTPVVTNDFLKEDSEYTKEINDFLNTYNLCSNILQKDLISLLEDSSSKEDAFNLTRFLILSLIKMNSEDNEPEDQEWLFKLQKKYEVLKRLHLNYNLSDKRKIGNHSESLMLYALFHIYLIKAYYCLSDEKKKATLLSTIFKVGDLIVSQKNKDLKNSDFLICHFSISLELKLYKHCRELYK